MTPQSGIIGNFCRLYSVLLYAYPREFRLQYGAAMQQVFRDRCRDLARTASPMALIRFARLGKDRPTRRDARSGEGDGLVENRPRHVGPLRHRQQCLHFARRQRRHDQRNLGLAPIHRHPDGQFAGDAPAGSGQDAEKPLPFRRSVALAWPPRPPIKRRRRDRPGRLRPWQRRAALRQLLHQLGDARH
jgi:hypothetical protein